MDYFPPLLDVVVMQEVDHWESNMFWVSIREVIAWLQAIPSKQDRLREFKDNVDFSFAIGLKVGHQPLRVVWIALIQQGLCHFSVDRFLAISAWSDFDWLFVNKQLLNVIVKVYRVVLKDLNYVLVCFQFLQENWFWFDNSTQLCELLFFFDLLRQVLGLRLFKQLVHGFVLLQCLHKFLLYWLMRLLEFILAKVLRLDLDEACPLIVIKNTKPIWWFRTTWLRINDQRWHFNVAKPNQIVWSHTFVEHLDKQIIIQVLHCNPKSFGPLWRLARIRCNFSLLFFSFECYFAVGVLFTKKLNVSDEFAFSYRELQISSNFINLHKILIN